MSSVFRRNNQNPVEVSDSWELAVQIESVDSWLANESNAKVVFGSILDIGFNSRLDGESVAVQGETIPIELMRKLVDLEITLWLSIYPAFEDSAE